MAVEVASAHYRAALAGFGIVKHRRQLPPQMSILPRPERPKRTPAEQWAALTNLRPRGA